ncbi:hypothetical protein M5K25_024779 [Dendrobium thyrsiflorum]|uniref:Uncharacterized protein n=1 Tax=Dendrobium thyrsiflorum TaxID=117978 RepID=A0ABD0U2X1_DENTH
MMERATVASLLVFLSCLLSSSLAVTSGSADGYTITGRIKIDDDVVMVCGFQVIRDDDYDGGGYGEGGRLEVEAVEWKLLWLEGV